MEKGKTGKQVMAALFAALTAICSQLTIPIQPVPITLGSFSALMAGGFLGKKYGTIALIIYVLLGAAGLPVFAMMRGGLSVVTGPGGGFIIGYALMAFLTGWVMEKTGSSFRGVLLGTIVGTAGCYTLGIAWYMFLAHVGLWPAMLLCMFPFIPGDSIKCLLVAFLVSHYKKYIIH
jgi:biotin transport system substrate-specific component